MTANARNFSLLHIICWVGVFLPTMLQLFAHGQTDTNYYLLNMVLPASMLIIFYTNYFWLVPKHYLQHDKKLYYVLNLLLIIILTWLAARATPTLCEMGYCNNSHNGITHKIIIRYVPQYAVTLALDD